MLSSPKDLHADRLQQMCLTVGRLYAGRKHEVRAIDCPGFHFEPFWALVGLVLCSNSMQIYRCSSSSCPKVVKLEACCRLKVCTIDVPSLHFEPFKALLGSGFGFRPNKLQQMYVPEKRRWICCRPEARNIDMPKSSF